VANTGVPRKYPPLSMLYPVFKMPEPPPPIDIEKLKSDLMSVQPKAQRTKKPQEFLASCGACGWHSEPVSSREELESDIEDAGGHVTVGGTMSCPMCFAPLNPERV